MLHKTSSELLETLISFDTTSSKSNKELIDFVQGYLSNYNIDSSIGYNDDGTKADLIATIGPMVEGGIVLSGHTDVVPVEGQSWNTDPFILHQEDGKLFGRGACDMKGFIAVVLSLVPKFLSSDLNVPLHFLLSYDEEIGCLGAPKLIARMIKDIPTPCAVIIGEPTSMKPVNAHKGVTLFETRIKGRSSHSSQINMGVNAIYYATACINYLQQLKEELKIGGSIDPRFDPPFATISFGMIKGGTAPNIVAEECALVWDCRCISPVDSEFVLKKLEDYCKINLIPEMTAIAPESSIITKKEVYAPPLIARHENYAEDIVCRLTGHNKAGVVSFTAEAGLFQEAGIPAVLCGPGSIEQAHRSNEYVETSQLKKCEDFLIKLSDWA